jgi:hypothetical protein
MNPSVFLPNTIHYHLIEDDTARLAFDATFRSHQIIRLFEFASNVLHICLPIRSVARTFETDHSVVKRAQLRDYEAPPAGGRHRELAHESEQEVFR